MLLFGTPSADVRFTSLPVYLILTCSPQLTAKCMAGARVKTSNLRRRRLLILLTDAFSGKKCIASSATG